MDYKLQPIVLLVENNVITTATCKMILKDEPIFLIHLETGHATLTYLKKTIPHVILLDFGLPDMNGMEILKTIYQQQLKCVVIVITTENATHLVIEAIHYGAFDFIEKPC